ncbi:hypothetical protein [Pseudomonas sp. dw_358]|uniref:hypothetical protein n=1 Tax=Pseudomonas sp. dw_358 TaxID=2720083 RepID=UPI001BD5B9DC|nr:hypothetical protein [Pseudomonas sp. dw_358]
MIIKSMVTSITIGVSLGLAAASSIPTKVEGLDLKPFMKSLEIAERASTLETAMKAPLYGEFLAEGHSRPLVTCRDYTAAQASEVRLLEPKVESEANGFRELLINCLAADLIAKAKPSDVTYLPEKLVTEDFLKNTPYYPGQIIANETRERLEKQRPEPSWWDVEPVEKIKRFDHNVVTLYLDGSKQTVVAIGRGDINGDGVEDAMLKVIDSINPPATYFNVRMYVITRMEERGKYQIIKSYDQ